MLNKMKLAVKIGCGFGVVIFLLVIISVVSWRGLSGVADGFTSYRELARDSNLAGRLQANMLMIRMNVKDFVITQSDKDINQYEEYFKKMNGFLEEAHVEIQKPERAVVIDEYSEDVIRYDANFKKVIALYKKRDQLVNDVLNVKGPQMEKKLTEIMRSAKDDYDAEAAYSAGEALRHLLLGRLYVIKFLDTNAEADKGRVEQEFKDLSKASSNLKTMLQDPQRKKLNDEVAKMSEEYQVTFEQVYQTIIERNDIITNGLDKMGPEMAEDVEVVKLSVKKDQDELGPIVQARSQNAVRVVVIVAVLAVIIAVVAAFFITKTISAPVQKVMQFVDNIAKGDFTKRLEIAQEDEIGNMSKALGQTVEELGLMIRDIITGVNTLSSSSTELSAIATQLSGSAEEGASKSNNVASASEQMSVNMSSVSAAMEQSSSNVQMVATSTEEMSATVNEIAQNAERAKKISEEAVSQSKNTSVKINVLGEAANKIGKVTEAITEISEQTNLLALNATIEAARAGEAGKGFAVVANEIKDLAKQTSEATVDIKNQIEEVQKTTDSTISDIENIGKVIDDINDVINTIASAVEEQSAATSEISENVAQAAAGIGEVNENVAQSSVAVANVSQDISEISRASDDINSASGNVEQSSIELSRLAEQLDSLVKKFKV